MIAANELRIGNFYDDNGAACRVTPSVIEEVYNSPRRWCKAIPLTEDWLERLGFHSKYKSNHMRWNIGMFDINQKSDEDEDGSSRPKEQVFYYEWTLEVQFVHQLQNLYFALTNKELELKPDP